MDTQQYVYAQPTHAEIAEELKRILASRRFTSAKRNSRFLEFIVGKVLAGTEGEIKEIVVAAEVYGRAGDYDPKADSVVRVEASRLRTRLKSYYEQEGRQDPVRITIAKGTYVPRFYLCAGKTAAADARESASRRPNWLATALSRAAALFGALWSRDAEHAARASHEIADALPRLRPETSFS